MVTVVWCRCGRRFCVQWLCSVAVWLASQHSMASVWWGCCSKGPVWASLAILSPTCTGGHPSTGSSSVGKLCHSLMAVLSNAPNRQHKGDNTLCRQHLWWACHCLLLPFAAGCGPPAYQRARDRGEWPSLQRAWGAGAPAWSSVCTGPCARPHRIWTARGICIFHSWLQRLWRTSQLQSCDMAPCCNCNQAPRTFCKLVCSSPSTACAAAGGVW
jgi:hypothetical protein